MSQNPGGERGKQRIFLVRPNLANFEATTFRGCKPKMALTRPFLKLHSPDFVWQHI